MHLLIHRTPNMICNPFQNQIECAICLANHTQDKPVWCSFIQQIWASITTTNFPSSHNTCVPEFNQCRNSWLKSANDNNQQHSIANKQRSSAKNSSKEFLPTIVYQIRPMTSQLHQFAKCSVQNQSIKHKTLRLDETRAPKLFSTKRAYQCLQCHITLTFERCGRVHLILVLVFLVGGFWVQRCVILLVLLLLALLGSTTSPRKFGRCLLVLQFKLAIEMRKPGEEIGQLFFVATGLRMMSKSWSHAPLRDIQSFVAEFAECKTASIRWTLETVILIFWKKLPATGVHSWFQLDRKWGRKLRLFCWGLLLVCGALSDHRSTLLTRFCVSCLCAHFIIWVWLSPHNRIVCNR